MIERLDACILDTYPDVIRYLSGRLIGEGYTDPVAIGISGKEPDREYGIVDGIKGRRSGIPKAKNIPMTLVGPCFFSLFNHLGRGLKFK